jgi:serine protease
MTQYCDGPSVPNKATKCPAGAAHVAYPTAPVLAGIWFANAKASPASATGRDLALQAIAAAKHFHNTSTKSNRYVQYVILSPPGTTPDGFNTPNQNFCAWHDYNGDANLPGGPVRSKYGDIAFTNFPYLTDAGANCGASFVNGNAGELDGVTIVEGHEYAETITDQNPAGGWTNQSGDPTYNGQENGDECSWVAVGQPGGAANVKMGTASYPMQATWSNDTTGCACQPGRTADTRVNTEAAKSEAAIISRLPMLSEMTLATSSVMAIAPVASETTRLASPALTLNSFAKTGRSDWTLYRSENVARPAITSASESLR